MLEALQDNALFVCGVVALVLAAALLCATLALIRRFGATKRTVAHGGVLDEAVDRASDEALILYDTATHRVRHVSGAERILGLSSRELETDVQALARSIDHDSLLDIREGVSAWDGRAPLAMEFAFSDEAIGIAPVGALAGAPGGAPAAARSTTLPAAPQVAGDAAGNLGEPRWGELRIAPCGEGKLLLSVRDVTAQHNVRRDLIEQCERAELGEHAKLMFLSNMSHEIRTPMNGIMGTLSLAKLHLDDAERMSGYLAQADDLLKYLLSVINDVLDISKIDNGKLEVEQRCFDITNVIRSEQNLFGEMIASKNIAFDVSVDELPTPYVIGDELRLTQVVTNLISNSQKFTNPGGTISLSLRLMQQMDGVLHVAIVESDTGKGMSPEFLADLFNPFSQEDSSISRRFGGTGLGMAISDQLTRLMGGQISVESELGVGTTFEIHLGLPIASDEEIAEYLETGAPALGEAGLAEEDRFKLEGSTILLAEDNMLNASIAIDMLEELGAHVEHAIDGVAACELFERSAPDHFDVVLMDVQMPNRNGWEAAQCIRALERADARTTPIFALSADAYMEDKRHSREVGMDGHISKPVEFEQLENLINEQLAVSMKKGPLHG